MQRATGSDPLRPQSARAVFHCNSQFSNPGLGLEIDFPAGVTAAGFSSARSTRRSASNRTHPMPTAAANVAPARMRAPPMPSPRHTSSMPAGAFPTSPSNTRGRYPSNFAARSATASMAATIALPFAPGTSSPTQRTGISSWPPAPNSKRPNWRNSSSSTMRASGSSSRVRRSSASAATGLCAIASTLQAIAAQRNYFR